MSTYATAFNEYTSGVSPSDWTSRWEAITTAWDIRSGGDDKVMFIDGTADMLVAWNDIDADSNRATVEVLMRCKGQTTTAGSDPNLGVCFRADYSGSTRTGYYVGFHGSTNLRARKVVANTESTLDTVAHGISGGFVVDTFYWMRVQISGTSTTSIKAKAWSGTIGDEPGTWALDITDTSSPITAAGYVGVYVNNSTTNAEIDFFSAGTNGDAAPSSAGVAVDLAGSATGVASATGAITHGVPLAGAAAGVASATGNLAVTHYGIITTPPLKNNAGTVLASETGVTVHLYSMAGGLVVTKTGQVTNAAGVLTVTDPALVAEVEYRGVVVLASGAAGLFKLMAV